MNLKGFSGCKIELIGGKVKKTSGSPSYNSRLKNQKEKQKKFKSDLPFLYSPQIFSSKRNSFDMEYIIGRDFISFVSESSKAELEMFSNDITLYILENIKRCKTREIKKAVFEKKISEIYKKRKYLLLLNFLEMVPSKMRIPTGVCHGDLTLSNIIFKKNKLILIDFLDGFIETPLIDIAKLRQDTKYKWSLDLYQKEYDFNKVNISLDYLDLLLHKSFTGIPSYDEYYHYFQFMNFARILPYAGNIKKLDYLKHTLSGIITKI